MSHSKRLLCRSLVVLMVAGAAACSSSGGGVPPAQTVAPTTFAIAADSLPKGANGEPLVARVNDQEIPLTDYERTLARYQQQPVANPGGLPKMVLETMIQQVLIDQAAAANQIVVSDDEVNTELQNLKVDAGGDAQWDQWLESNRYTQDELIHALRSTLLTSRMRDRITSDLNNPVDQVHARHILVSTQEQANELLVRLRNGEDFAAMANTYSLDASSSVNGGDLGWFTQEQLLEPALAQVAFGLQPGQIAGPVQTTLGYHIIQTLEREKRPVEPLTRAQLAQTRFENWLASLAITAKIEQYL